ncbi:MAG: membrane protein insertion efficiency factor YidD [Deltaproteobacteria bacterium]|nr:membrane protein insertion efficiency factor YidD [Deltaproteobacteria bacterium]
MKVFNRFAITLIRFYKVAISPWLPKACRFHPTCSEYASECFRRFSFFRAVFLTIKRLGRCHPFCEGGFDPVPDQNASQE